MRKISTNMNKLEHQTNKLATKPELEETKPRNLFNCANDMQTYKCDGCEYDTEYWIKYIEHRFGTRDDKTFPLDYVTSLICKICDLETFSKFIFMKHTYNGCIGATHSAHLYIDNDTLYCTGSDFEVRQYCDQCSVHYGDVDYFKFHKRSAHYVKDYVWLKCDHCTFQTLRSCSLEKHKSSNSCKNQSNEDKWFECNKCSFKTRWKRCLTFHFYRRHKHIYKCERCFYTTRVKESIKYHRFRIHNLRDHSEWFHCEQCSFKAAGKDNLKKHITSKHESGDKSQWLLCDQCGLRTQSSSRLQRHRREKHTPDFAGHNCPHCSYKAKQRYHVTLHVIQRHTPPEDVKWFECEHCSYKAKIKASLKNHLLRKHKSVIKKDVV